MQIGRNVGQNVEQKCHSLQATRSSDFFWFITANCQLF